MPLPSSFSPFPHLSRLSHLSRLRFFFHLSWLRARTVHCRSKHKSFFDWYVSLFLTADRTAFSFLCYPIVTERRPHAQITEESRTVGNSPSRTVAHVTHGIFHRISDRVKYNSLSKVVCLVIGSAGGSN